MPRYCTDLLTFKALGRSRCPVGQTAGLEVAQRFAWPNLHTAAHVYLVAYVPVTN